MKTRLAMFLLVISVVGTAAISFSIFNSEPGSIIMTDFGPSEGVFVNTAHAGPALEQRDVAQVMRVRVVETGPGGIITAFSSISRGMLLTDTIVANCGKDTTVSVSAS